MADPWMQPNNKSKYWENMLRKYEERNARLQSEECELRHKLEALECSLPIMMCMNMMNQPELTQTQATSDINQPQATSEMPVRDAKSNEYNSKTPYCSCTDCSKAAAGLCDCKVPTSKDPRIAQNEQAQSSKPVSAPIAQTRSDKKCSCSTEANGVPESASQNIVSPQNEFCPCIDCPLLRLGQCDCGIGSSNGFCPCEDCELLAQGICDCGPQNEEDSVVTGDTPGASYASVSNSHKGSTKPFKPCDCKFKKMKKSSKTTPKIQPKSKNGPPFFEEEIMITNPMLQDAREPYSGLGAQLPTSMVTSSPIVDRSAPDSRAVNPNTGGYSSGRGPSEPPGALPKVPSKNTKPLKLQNQNAKGLPEGFFNENCNCRKCLKITTGECLCLAETNSNISSTSALHDDVSLLDSEDFLLIDRVKRLAEKEKALKQNINELHHKENAINETIETVQFMRRKNGTTLNNTSPEGDNQGSMMENLQRLNNLLVQENGRMSDELADIRLDMKQIKERLEGPMQRELEREKRKNKNMEDDLVRAEEEKNRTEEANKKEVEFMIMQLEAAAAQITDLNAMNSRLKEELHLMNDKYNELHQDLVNQKISEANTLSRMKAAQAAAASMANAFHLPPGTTMQDSSPIEVSPVKRVLEGQNQLSALLVPNETVHNISLDDGNSIYADQTAEEINATEQNAVDSPANQQLPTEETEQDAGSVKTSPLNNPIINMVLVQQEIPDLEKKIYMDESGEMHEDVKVDFEGKKHQPVENPMEQKFSDVGNDIGITDATLANTEPQILKEVKEVKAVKITTKPNKARDRVKEGSSLNALARDLSDLLHENENNANIPRDMKDTAYEIKVLVDVVDKQLANRLPRKDKNDEKPPAELYEKPLISKPDEKVQPEKVKQPGKEKCACLETALSVLTKKLEEKWQPTGTSQMNNKIKDVVKMELPRVKLNVEPAEETAFEDAVEELPMENYTNTDYDENATEDIEVETFVSDLDSPGDEIMIPTQENVAADEPVTKIQNIHEPLNARPEDIKAIPKMEPTGNSLNENVALHTKAHSPKRSRPPGVTKEVDIKAQLETDADVDINAEVMIVKKNLDGINITTTLTRSGTLEVITEGPAGVIETVMTLTESGNIEVVTEITDYEDDVKSEEDRESEEETTTDTDTGPSSKKDDDQNDQSEPDSGAAPGSGSPGNSAPPRDGNDKDGRNNDNQDKPCTEYNPGECNPCSRFQHAALNNIPLPDEIISSQINDCDRTIGEEKVYRNEIDNVQNMLHPNKHDKAEDELHADDELSISTILETLEDILAKYKVSREIFLNSLDTESLEEIANMISLSNKNYEKEKTNMLFDNYALNVPEKANCPTSDFAIPLDNSKADLNLYQSISPNTVSICSIPASTDLKSQRELEEITLEIDIISEIMDTRLELMNDAYSRGKRKGTTLYNNSSIQAKLAKSDSNAIGKVRKEIQMPKLLRSSSVKQQSISEQDLKNKYERQCTKARGDKADTFDVNDLSHSKSKTNISNLFSENYAKANYLNSIKPLTEIQVAVIEAQAWHKYKFTKEDIQRLNLQTLFKSSSSIEELIEKYSSRKHKEKKICCDDSTGTYAAALLNKSDGAEQDNTSSEQNFGRGESVQNTEGNNSIQTEAAAKKEHTKKLSNIVEKLEGDDANNLKTVVESTNEEEPALEVEPKEMNKTNETDEIIKRNSFPQGDGFTKKQSISENVPAKIIEPNQEDQQIKQDKLKEDVLDKASLTKRESVPAVKNRVAVEIPRNSTENFNSAQTTSNVVTETIPEKIKAVSETKGPIKQKTKTNNPVSSIHADKAGEEKSVKVDPISKSIHKVKEKQESEIVNQPKQEKTAVAMNDTLKKPAGIIPKVIENNTGDDKIKVKQPSEMKKQMENDVVKKTSLIIPKVIENNTDADKIKVKQPSEMKKQMENDVIKKSSLIIPKVIQNNTDADKNKVKQPSEMKKQMENDVIKKSSLVIPKVIENNIDADKIKVKQPSEMKKQMENDVIQKSSLGIPKVIENNIDADKIKVKQPSEMKKQMENDVIKKSSEPIPKVIENNTYDAKVENNPTELVSESDKSKRPSSDKVLTKKIVKEETKLYSKTNVYEDSKEDDIKVFVAEESSKEPENLDLKINITNKAPSIRDNKLEEQIVEEENIVNDTSDMSFRTAAEEMSKSLIKEEEVAEIIEQEDIVIDQEQIKGESLPKIDDTVQEHKDAINKSDDEEMNEDILTKIFDDVIERQVKENESPCACDSCDCPSVDSEIEIQESEEICTCVVCYCEREEAATEKCSCKSGYCECTDDNSIVTDKECSCKRGSGQCIDQDSAAIEIGEDTKDLECECKPSYCECIDQDAKSKSDNITLQSFIQDTECDCKPGYCQCIDEDSIVVQDISVKNDDVSLKDDGVKCACKPEDCNCSSNSHKSIITAVTRDDTKCTCLPDCQCVDQGVDKSASKLYEKASEYSNGCYCKPGFCKCASVTESNEEYVDAIQAEGCICKECICPTDTEKSNIKDNTSNCSCTASQKKKKQYRVVHCSCCTCKPCKCSPKSTHSFGVDTKSDTFEKYKNNTSFEGDQTILGDGNMRKSDGCICVPLDGTRGPKEISKASKKNDDEICICAKTDSSTEPISTNQVNAISVRNGEQNCNCAQCNCPVEQINHNEAKDCTCDSCLCESQSNNSVECMCQASKCACPEGLDQLSIVCTCERCTCCIKEDTKDSETNCTCAECDCTTVEQIVNNDKTKSCTCEPSNCLCEDSTSDIKGSRMSSRNSAKIIKSEAQSVSIKSNSILHFDYVDCVCPNCTCIPGFDKPSITCSCDKCTCPIQEDASVNKSNRTEQLQECSCDPSSCLCEEEIICTCDPHKCSCEYHTNIKNALPNEIRSISVKSSDNIDCVCADCSCITDIDNESITCTCDKCKCENIDNTKDETKEPLEDAEYKTQDVLNSASNQNGPADLNLDIEMQNDYTQEDSKNVPLDQYNMEGNLTKLDTQHNFHIMSNSDKLSSIIQLVKGSCLKSLLEYQNHIVDFDQKEELNEVNSTVLEAIEEDSHKVNVVLQRNNNRVDSNFKISNSRKRKRTRIPVYKGSYQQSNAEKYIRTIMPDGCDSMSDKEIISQYTSAVSMIDGNKTSSLYKVQNLQYSRSGKSIDMLKGDGEVSSNKGLSVNNGDLRRPTKTITSSYNKLALSDSKEIDSAVKSSKSETKQNKFTSISSNLFRTEGDQLSFATQTVTVKNEKAYATTKTKISEFDLENDTNKIANSTNTDDYLCPVEQFQNRVLKLCENTDLNECKEIIEIAKQLTDPTNAIFKEGLAHQVFTDENTPLSNYVQMEEVNGSNTGDIISNVYSTNRTFKSNTLSYASKDNMLSTLNSASSDWWAEHSNIADDLQNLLKELTETLSQYEENKVQQGDIFSNKTDVGITNSKSSVLDFQQPKGITESMSNVKCLQEMIQNHLSQMKNEDEKLSLKTYQSKIYDSGVETISVSEPNGLTQTKKSQKYKYNCNDSSSTLYLSPDEIIAYIPKLNNRCRIRSYNGSVSKIIARNSSLNKSVFKYPIQFSDVKCIYLNPKDIEAESSRNINEGISQTFDSENQNARKSGITTCFNYVDNQQINKESTNFSIKRYLNQQSNQLISLDVTSTSKNNNVFIQQVFNDTMQSQNSHEYIEELLAVQNYNESNCMFRKYHPQGEIINNRQQPMLINGSNDKVPNQIIKLDSSDIEESDDEWVDALETIPQGHQANNVINEGEPSHRVKSADAIERMSDERFEFEIPEDPRTGHGNSCECIDCLTAPYSKAFTVKKTMAEPMIECPICNRIECIGDCEMIYQYSNHVQREFEGVPLGVTQSHEIYHQCLVNDCTLRVGNGFLQNGDVYLDFRSLPCMMNTICQSNKSLEFQELSYRGPSKVGDVYNHRSSSVKDLYISDNKEITHSDEELDELHNIMRQISSACMEAESCLPNFPIYYQNSSTNLQVAFKNRQTTCNSKDSVMKSMIYELQMRVMNTCNTQSECSEMFGHIQNYNTDVQNFGFEEFPQSLVEQNAYQNSCGSTVDIQKRYSRRSNRIRNNHSSGKICAQTITEVVPSKCTYEEVMDVRPLKMIEVKRIGDACLLVKWQEPANEKILGYEVCVNEEVKTRVYRKSRTMAVISAIPLDHHPIVNISVYGCTNKGRCLPPALASFHI